MDSEELILILPKKSRKLSPEARARAAARCRKWRADNREHYLQYHKDYKKRKFKTPQGWRPMGPKAISYKEWMDKLKDAPCSDCKIKFPQCCMDFDHVRGTKEYNISYLFTNRLGKVTILKELEKCELVCSNCHRIRTRNRRLNNGRKQIELGLSNTNAGQPSNLG